MRVAVIQFPGTNAHWDALLATARIGQGDLGHSQVSVESVFHTHTDLRSFDAVILPGGFAHGDYLRAGALCRTSPITGALRAYARRGGPVLGICNGFQVLTELGMLPGALTQNQHLRFECRDVWLRCESPGAFTRRVGEVIRCPIAHGQGRYHCDGNTLKRLQGEDLIAFRYCDRDGRPGRDHPVNPNGSLHGIAGVYNDGRNVLGMMPHPERAFDPVLGSDQGARLFRDLVTFLEQSP